MAVAPVDGARRLRGRRGAGVASPSVSQSGHAPSLVGWFADGTPTTNDVDAREVAERAWVCSCGWSETRRPVMSRFFSPVPDEGNRLRAIRLARDDRVAHAAWVAHAETGPAEPLQPRRPPIAAPADPAATPGPHLVEAVVSADTEPANTTSTDRAERSAPSVLVPGGALSERARRAARRHDPRVVPTLTEVDVDAGLWEDSDSASDTESGSSGRVGKATRGSAAVGRAGTSSSPIGVGPADPGSGPLVAAAAERAREARERAEDAERALDQAVAEARVTGMSWRAIAAATGADHHRSRQRWGAAGEL